MQVIFFGSSDYCLPILETLRANFELKLIITKPDRPIGRHQTLTPSAAKSWAIENNVPFVAPDSLKKETEGRKNVIKEMDRVQPDLAIVCDFGFIIPESVFSLPKHGTFNIHFSRLPELRGPSPVQFTLLAGKTSAWVTVFRLENPPELGIKMDSGPILWQKEYPIDPNDTTGTLYPRLFTEVAKDLPKVLQDYSLSSYNPQTLTSQDHSKATYCRFLTKQDGFVEWEKLTDPSHYNLEPSHLYNQYRAVTPWPGLWSIVNFNGEKKIIKIIDCCLSGGHLSIIKAQIEGKAPVKFSDISPNISP